MTLNSLFRAIATGDSAAATQMLKVSPALAREAVATGATRQSSGPHFLEQLGRVVYAGDTALHIAATAYALPLVKRLLANGAGVNARNRRGAAPLHSAAVGSPGSPRWNPTAQAAVIEQLILAGADPNAADMGGATPLHKAVRTRAAAAVEALLANGADPMRRNKSGSTPLQLADHTTGRSGSGSPEAREQQAEIMVLLAGPARSRPVGLAEATYVVQNAGLVIAWPFLPQLFKVRRLTKLDQFVSERSRQRAVHLLAYLASGKRPTADSDLALCKVLCGFSPGDLVASDGPLTTKDLEAAESLLAAIVAQWRPVENTTNSGLRDSFLMRAGSLKRAGSSWQLQVTPRPYDMLLDQLPWSHTTVHFAWMTASIEVRWR